MFLIISTTTNKKNIANVISEKLLSNKLTPCTHISSKNSSAYLWNKKIVNTEEFVLNIKTTDLLKQKVVDVIINNHNYQTPEIISTQIEIHSNSYVKWFNECLKK